MSEEDDEFYKTRTVIEIIQQYGDWDGYVNFEHWEKIKYKRNVRENYTWQVGMSIGLKSETPKALFEEARWVIDAMKKKDWHKKMGDRSITIS